MTSFQEWLQEQLLKDLLPGEVCYPLYNVSASWIENIKEGYEPRPSDIVDLPPGKMRNGTSWTTMFKDARDIEDLLNETKLTWWPEYARKREQYQPESPIITAKTSGREVWCMAWFSHWTFDNGFNDQEFLSSFQRYVDRIQRANEHFRYNEDQSLLHGREEYFCLMGAEDRWRWCGLENENGERTDPPCRCEHCQKQGVVRIGH